LNEVDRPIRLFVIAGEASGDVLAARFVEALRRRVAPRDVEIMGVGGLPLQELGLVSRFPQADVQLMGVVAVIKSLPRLLGHIADTANAVIDARPDLLLTVDVPDFSLRVARKVRRADPSIPIMHWVAPTVWAWRPGRAKAMAPHVDRLLALLPFEPAAFARLGGPPTRYVGHPLLDLASELRPDPDERRIRDNAAAPVILLLPGSRRSEIDHMLPVFREAARLIAARYPHAHLVLPAVRHLAERIGAQVSGWETPVEVVIGEAPKRAAFRRARAALAASGTVTLELALAGVPTVGAYRGHPIEAFIARRMVKTDTVLLCNLVLGRSVVPEYMQEEATPAALAAALMRLLPNDLPRTEQIVAFSELDRIMALPEGRPSADLAVDEALQLVSLKPVRT
jgi:lipid-A-disaccharide synthase